MEQSEQNVVASAQLPKPAALQDTPTKDATFAPTGSPIFDAKGVSIYYGSFRAVTNVSLTIYENEITAFIGPSGCGKTTVLRTLNRLNDLIPEARVEGEVHYRGANLYGSGVSPIAVRRRIGMVFVSGEFSMSMSRAWERSGSEPSQGPPGMSPSSSTSAFQPPDPSWRSSS